MEQEYYLGQTITMKRDIAPHAGLKKGSQATVASVWQNSLIVVTQYGLNYQVFTKDVEPVAQPAKYEITCLRCGNTWAPRVTKPQQCIRCKSAYWDKPRTRSLKGGDST